MKRISLTLLFLGSLFSYSQTYVETTVLNSAYVEQMCITFEKGDSLVILNDNSAIPTRSYFLENQITPDFEPPITPPNWSYIVLYKQHKTTYCNNIGVYFKFVLDNNGNSWLLLH